MRKFEMPRFAALMIAAIGLVPLMGAQPVEAQRIDSNRAVQRYNRVAKGSNIAEWHRRLFDEDPTVRLEAVESLGEQGSEECVKPLLDATADSDPRVRAKAFDYLGAIGSHSATQVLTQYLFLTAVDRSSKQRILVALGRIRDPAAARPLHDFIQKSEDEELRCGALYALGEIGDPSSLAILEEYAQSSVPHEARIAHDAEAKINARVAQAPNTQPTLLQLEKLLGPRGGGGPPGGGEEP